MHSEAIKFKKCPCCGRDPQLTIESEPHEYEGLTGTRELLRLSCSCGLQTVAYLIDRSGYSAEAFQHAPMIHQMPESAVRNLAKIWNHRV